MRLNLVVLLAIATVAGIVARVAPAGTMRRDRGEALAALRFVVPASSVPDDAVTISFWSPCDAAASGLRRFPRVDIGGFWVGEDRCIVLACQPGRPGVVRDPLVLRYLEGGLDGRNGMSPHMRVPGLCDWTARSALERELFRLVRLERAVPLWMHKAEASYSAQSRGCLVVEYVDGFDEGCGHMGLGDFRFDPVRLQLYPDGHLL